MRLGSEWNSHQEVNGGYIVVKNIGVAVEPLCYHPGVQRLLGAKMIMKVPLIVALKIL